ncbi:hypothetical protein L4D04_05525 [Photobacterium angustum]|uniref:DUF11 domain-containing protein n=1 Tax=Photobacterium angustum (strain S14 / CCUG 15956) TaxID=314292 RepID=Q1ZU66_PHOAS|nr:hypothetical protein [Photobacterium angustum]EAS66544.1 hypothetical protein VAS14_14544 [Photobacterium angustum S14]
MKTQLKPISKWFIAGIITAGSASLINPALAQTPVNTPISNKAFVEYTDESGIKHTVESNELIINVAQVYSATIEEDRNEKGVAGKTVNFAHKLTNTGNGPDTYSISTLANLSSDDSRLGDITTSLIDSDISYFFDENCNGKTDDGELPFAGDTVTLDAGESACMVLAFQVPVDANKDDKMGAQLIVKAHEGTGSGVDGKVEDKGDNNDATDPLAGFDTNGDVLTVTNNAVLDLEKTATPIEGTFKESDADINFDVNGDGSIDDAPVNIIKYEVTVQNDSITPAKDVVIFDGAPEHTVVLPSGTYGPQSFNINSLQGDTPVEVVDDLADEGTNIDLNQDGVNGSTEADIGIDLNNNGNTTDTDPISGVYAVKKELSVGKVGVTFHVAYDPLKVPAETDLVNIAFACADLNNDGNFDGEGECNDPDPTTSGPDTSNPTTNPSENNSGGSITDTGDKGNDPDDDTNGGGDDDGSVDGTQTITTVPAGAEAYFYNIVTNLGNKADSYDLVTENDLTNPFPAGTSFSYQNGTGTADLTDTNGNFTVDTGLIDPVTCLEIDSSTTTVAGTNIELTCNQKLIRVVASLPQDGGSKATESLATTTATSFNDPTVTFSKIEKLESITGPTVDVANTAITSIDPATNIDDAASGVATTFDIALGESKEVGIYIANEGGINDSFTLLAEGVNEGDMVPDGWSVVFKHNGIDTNADGSVDVAASGEIITATPNIGPGSVMHITAVFTAPADAAKALADSDQVGAVNGNAASGDTDLDYIISIKVSSNVTGASDRKLEAFDVESTSSVDISPDSLSGQAENGGSEVYPHTLTNTGNTTEEVTLGTSDSGSGDGFTSIIMVDHDNDPSTPDKNIALLCADGETEVLAEQADGSVASIEIACPAGTLNLEPGEEVSINVQVQVPPEAPEGYKNNTTITATGSSAGASDEAIDTTEVVNGDVTLDKYVGVSAGCDGTITGMFEKDPSNGPGVKPGECLVWKLIASNNGLAKTENTIIRDEIKSGVETMETASFKSCRLSETAPGDVIYSSTVLDPALQFICDPQGPSADANYDPATMTISFDVGDLESGDLYVAEFMTRVE